MRLRVHTDEQVVVDGFVAELERHNVGGISIHGALTPDGVKTLARALGTPPREGARGRGTRREPQPLPRCRSPVATGSA